MESCPPGLNTPVPPLGGDVCVLTLLSLKDGECFAQMVSMWGECGKQFDQGTSIQERDEGIALFIKAPDFTCPF